MVTPFRLAAPFAAVAGDERRWANRTCTPSDCGGAAAKRRTAGKAFLSREEWRLCRQGKKVESRRCRTGAFTVPIALSRRPRAGHSDLCVTLTPGGRAPYDHSRAPTAFPASPGRYQEPADKIGSASCGERVCKKVSITWVAGSYRQQTAKRS